MDREKLLNLAETCECHAILAVERALDDNPAHTHSRLEAASRAQSMFACAAALRAIAEGEG